MARFSLDDYETVESRLRRFWKDHSDGAIIVDNITTEGDRTRGEWVCTASVYFHHEDIRPRGTDTAFERDGGQGPNQTSALENCATSAIGRALATANFTTSKHRASRTEMAKAQRADAVVAQITALDVQAAATLQDLNDLWSKATDSGDSIALVSEFSARKKALGG